MDDGDEPDVTRDVPPGSDASGERLSIEGMRPPFTLEQRRRRAAVTAIVVAYALVVLLWPAISPHVNIAAIGSAPAATATGGGFTSGLHFQSGVTIVSGSSSGVSGTPATMCPVTPLITSNGWNEMHADVVGNGDVWALLLSGPKASANSAELIAWRATGSGAFQVVASGPNAARLLPVNSPDPHPGGSNWQRPGDEWGTNFIFPTPGCWQLQVTRGTNLIASVWLSVGA
jgi:hypothetical protein